MLKLRTTLAALAIVAIAVSGTVAWASDPSIATTEKVAYQLTGWRTAHAKGQQAEKIISTLKKLRCQVKVGSHNGHTDVTYRCPKWQSMILKDHKTAHQWETWLKKYGFKTKHTH